MSPRGMMTITVLLYFILGLLHPPAACFHMSKACCTRYTRKPVPLQRIKGYREQTAMENCRIEAIIFYTMKKSVQICATREDKWVRKILESLSSKQKMSKARSAAGETQRRKSVTPSFIAGDGSFFSTTETLPNSTEGFY